MDIERAVSFVEEHGSDLEKAHLRQVLYGVQPEPDVIRPFTQLQNGDGGFPFKLTQKNISTINDTLVALYWLDDLGMLESPPADGAFEYILAVQKDDGGWDETPAVARLGPPPWASPGDLRARLYLSADATFWLAARGYRSGMAFQKALDFLLKHREETGRFYGFLHTTWIATGAFAIAGEQYRSVVKQGLQALRARPLSEWVDSQMGWALDCLARAGLSHDEPFVAGCLAKLVRRQATDGRWTSEDGEPRSAAATLEVLKVLKYYHLLER